MITPSYHKIMETYMVHPGDMIKSTLGYLPSGKTEVMQRIQVCLFLALALFESTEAVLQNGQRDALISFYQVKLLELLNHCTDKHVWALDQCDHRELDSASRNKEWLNPSGPDIIALEKVLLNARFLSTMRYYVTCQTTSELESFISHLLMYAAKRQSFTYGVYKARCQLAAIDYMMHLDRPYKYNKNGEQCFNMAFSKANQWIVKPVKEKKQYDCIQELLLDIISSYCLGLEKLRDPIESLSSDPVNTAETIAPTPPPHTKELVKSREPRLKSRAGTSGD